jgi:hypothetical protein
MRISTQKKYPEELPNIEMGSSFSDKKKKKSASAKILMQKGEDCNYDK